MESKSKRTYQSTRRKEQANETRQRIMAAAQELFLSQGYSGATMNAIARRAEVAPLTVFSIFGSKRALLAELVRVAVGGDADPIPLLERPGPRTVLADTEPVRQIQGFAQGISQILERVAPILDTMYLAAKSEPEIASLRREMLAERYGNIHVFVEHVAKNTPLRNDLDPKTATDIVWSLASPEMYLLLTRERGWKREQFASWLIDSMMHLILP